MITEKFVINKIEILLGILKFCWTNSLGNTATADLYKMFNSFVDTPILPDTRYLIDKLFYPKTGLEYHAVRPSCKTYIDKFQWTIQCQVCTSTVMLKDPCYRDFFIALDIRDEIQHLLEGNADYYSGTVLNGRGENRNDFADICDGLLYKKFVASLPNEDKSNYLTFIFNSDGSPLFTLSLLFGRFKLIQMKYQYI